MRTLLRGAVFGVLLSALRAPAGLTLFDLPIAGAASTLGWRAVALVLVGLGCFAALRRPGLGLWAATAAGYALHALVLSAWWRPESTFGLCATALLGLALVFAVAWDERRPQEPEDPPHAHRAARAAERIGLFLAGLGAALALETVARHVRGFGLGREGDDTLAALALLGLGVLGALGLGWLARLERLRNLSLPLGTAAVCTAACVALGTATELVKVLPLEHYLARFGLELADAGTPGYGLLVAAALFALPGLAAGFALCGARNGAQLLALCAGAAQGLLYAGWRLRGDGDADAVQQTLAAAQLVPEAILIGVGGAALAILSSAGTRKLERYVALALVLALAWPALTRETFALTVRAPWDTSRMLSPRLFQLTLDVPEGLLTVETSGDSQTVTLDGHALVPERDGWRADDQRLELAVQALPPAAGGAAGSAPARSVLVLGLVDARRARTLERLGFARIDRTLACHAALERIEMLLFKEHKKPAGALLSPAEARERVARGEYDLVLVPSVTLAPGAAPTLELPARTVAVVWVPAEAPLASWDFAGEVLLAATGLDDAHIGLVVHAERPERAGSAVRAVTPAGEPLGAEFPLGVLALRDVPQDRARRHAERARTFERLAAAAVPARAEFLRALARLERAQVPSSPFENAAQRVELTEPELDALRRSALALEPDAFVHGIWNGIAQLLTARRDVELVRRHLEPLAAERGPWPELEHALARADLEALEPETALRRLARVEDLARQDADHWELVGDAHRAAGDLPGAANAWRRSFELRPVQYAVYRKLAIVLVRLGDPEGPQRIENCLRIHPRDTALQAFLAPGPWPADPPLPTQ